MIIIFQELNKPMAAFCSAHSQLSGRPMFWNLKVPSSESLLSTISGPSPSNVISSEDRSSLVTVCVGSKTSWIAASSCGLAATAFSRRAAAVIPRPHMRKLSVTGRRAWRCSVSRWLSETVSAQRMSPAVETAQGSTLSRPTRATIRSLEARRARWYSSSRPERVEATPGVLSSATDET
jgi:hypothetical protein